MEDPSSNDSVEVFKMHAAFSRSKLMTSDPHAAAGFHGQVLSGKFDMMNMGMGPFPVIKVGDLMGMPPGADPMPPTWGCFFTVDNVDDVVAKCTALGGRVVMPQTSVKGVGRMAVRQDPQGAVFNVRTISAT